jgi:sec-independent protein translocase protein TatA
METTMIVPAFFGGIGPWEILIILLIILLLFGARKLPALARSLGKSLGEFRRGREEGERSLKELQDTVEKPASDEAKSSEDAPQPDKS